MLRQFSARVMLPITFGMYNCKVARCHSFNMESVEELSSLLHAREELRNYVDTIVKNNITGAQLKAMTNEEFLSLGISNTAHQDQLRGVRTLAKHTKHVERQPVHINLPQTHEVVRQSLPDDFEHSSTFSNFESFKLQ